MYFWERRNEIRDSDEKSAGCGILVVKEWECGIRIPLPDPVAGLEIISEESPDTMTGQVHFSSVTYRF